VTSPDVPGLLLVNLGTPQAPRPREVRRYLREFLSDPRVLDMPAPLRWLVLALIILPFRPRRSAEQYAKIWTERGSPLLVLSRALEEKVRQRLADSAVVELAMRYGTPSIADALASFHKRGVRRIVVFPLYPQYSSAATGSSVEEVFRAVSREWNVPQLTVVPAFFDDPRYIDCFVEAAKPSIAEVSRPLPAKRRLLRTCR
jgi:ferrochelatase